jgi:hypothetical protein
MRRLAVAGDDDAQCFGRPGEQATPRTTNEVPGPVPWISPDALAEQERLLLESQYARLHLNQWVASEDRLVDPEALADAVTLDGPQEAQAGAHTGLASTSVSSRTAPRSRSATPRRSKATAPVVSSSTGSSSGKAAGCVR